MSFDANSPVLVSFIEKVTGAPMFGLVADRSFIVILAGSRNLVFLKTELLTWDEEIDITAV